MKGIKREETAYPTLKDERYFDGFRPVFLAKTAVLPNGTQWLG